jgi:hypothetical protein
VFFVMGVTVGTTPMPRQWHSYERAMDVSAAMAVVTASSLWPIALQAALSSPLWR